jgi:histidine decarboxylase
MYSISRSDRKQLEALERDIKERTQLFIGYPVATDFDYSEIYPFFNYFLNNIGDPCRDSLCWVNTKEMEKEIVSFYAMLLHAPEDDTWGYITGSTEENLYGLSIARERYPSGIRVSQRR